MLKTKLNKTYFMKRNAYSTPFKRKETLLPQEELKLWKRYKNQASRELHEYIVEYYLPLVSKEVSKLSIRVRDNCEKEDLLGTGVIGLQKAILLFEPDKNDNFSAFASHKIRGAILDQLRKQDHLTRSQRKYYHQICACINKLSNELGRCPSYEEIAQDIGMQEHEVVQYIGMASNSLSLDGENEDGLKYKDLIEDRVTEKPDDLMDKTMSKELMREAFRMLPERDQQILYLKHYENLKAKEIALALGISEGRISQIYKEILVKLRGLMNLE